MMHLKASILRSIFSPILRFLGMLTPPPSEMEFPGDADISCWAAVLHYCYCPRDPEKSPKDRLRMQTFKVIAIRRYRKKQNLEHEYLVAKAANPDLGHSRYIRIERRSVNNLKLNTCPANDTTARSPYSSQSTLSLSSQSSRVLTIVPAHDQATQMAHGRLKISALAI